VLGILARGVESDNFRFVIRNIILVKQERCMIWTMGIYTCFVVPHLLSEATPREHYLAQRGCE
jgi:hypothetical protein